MRADNSPHLIAAAKKRSEESVERVHAAIRELHRSGEPVNISKVARRANVSRTFLHSHPDLMTTVRDLQARNPGPEPLPARQRASERSLLTRIVALTERNKKLRRENEALRRKLEVTHGDLRDLKHRPTA